MIPNKPYVAYGNVIDLSQNVRRSESINRSSMSPFGCMRVYEELLLNGDVRGLVSDSQRQNKVDVYGMCHIYILQSPHTFGIERHVCSWFQHYTKTIFSRGSWWFDESRCESTFGRLWSLRYHRKDLGYCFYSWTKLPLKCTSSIFAVWCKQSLFVVFDRITCHYD